MGSFAAYVMPIGSGRFDLRQLWEAGEIVRARV